MTLHSSGSEDFWVERRMVARVLKRVNQALDITTAYGLAASVA